MALFADQQISCLEDWKDHDSKLSILSEQESTSIEAKSRLAQKEMESELTGFLLAHSGLSEGASRELLKRVVVTEPMSRWHSLLTLSLFYADLALLQNSPLHREQASYYERKATSAFQQLKEIGVGIVSLPIPRAPLPAVVLTPGANSARFLRGRVQFMGEDGAFGAPGPEMILDLTAGEAAQVTVEHLPSNCRAWNLYLGESSERLHKANVSPLLAGEIFEVTGSVPLEGSEVLSGLGQQPNQFVVRTNKRWS